MRFLEFDLFFLCAVVSVVTPLVLLFVVVHGHSHSLQFVFWNENHETLSLHRITILNLRNVKGLWRNGNASDYGSEDSRFDPWQARIFFVSF